MQNKLVFIHCIAIALPGCAPFCCNIIIIIIIIIAAIQFFFSLWISIVEMLNIFLAHCYTLCMS